MNMYYSDFSDLKICFT